MRQTATLGSANTHTYTQRHAVHRGNTFCRRNTADHTESQWVGCRQTQSRSAMLIYCYFTQGINTDSEHWTGCNQLNPVHNLVGPVTPESWTFSSIHIFHSAAIKGWWGWWIIPCSIPHKPGISRANKASVCHISWRFLLPRGGKQLITHFLFSNDAAGQGRGRDRALWKGNRKS